ncbi:MAG TPA: hypothetical protein VMT54_00915 [Candidatus Cybelea sp.]|nr:hypothetical protein [Candidatus Cybelea sp.]
MANDPKSKLSSNDKSKSHRPILSEKELEKVAGGTTSSGKVSLSSIVVTKPVDKTTP